MPTDRPADPAARANDQFRRTVGKDGGVRGAVVFDQALSTLTLRQRRFVVEAVRAYGFSAADGDQHALRRTATVTVQGVAYRFCIEPEAGDDGADPKSRLLIISRA